MSEKLIIELLKEILNRFDGPAESYPPTKRRVQKGNGSALALLALIVGILLGVIAAALLKGCTMQNACIIEAEPADPVEIIEAIGGVQIDGGPAILPELLPVILPELLRGKDAGTQ